MDTAGTTLYFDYCKDAPYMIGILLGRDPCGFCHNEDPGGKGEGGTNLVYIKHERNMYTGNYLALSDSNRAYN